MNNDEDRLSEFTGDTLSNLRKGEYLHTCGGTIYIKEMRRRTQIGRKWERKRS